MQRKLYDLLRLDQDITDDKKREKYFFSLARADRCIFCSNMRITQIMFPSCSRAGAFLRFIAPDYLMIVIMIYLNCRSVQRD